MQNIFLFTQTRVNMRIVSVTSLNITEPRSVATFEETTDGVQANELNLIIYLF